MELSRKQWSHCSCIQTTCHFCEHFERNCTTFCVPYTLQHCCKLRINTSSRSENWDQVILVIDTRENAWYINDTIPLPNKHMRENYRRAHKNHASTWPTVGPRESPLTSHAAITANRKWNCMSWEEGKRYCAAGWVSVKLVQPRQRGRCWNCKVDYLVGDRAITGSLCEPTIVLRQQRFTLRLYLLHGVTGCFMEYHAWRERSGKGVTEKQG